MAWQLGIEELEIITPSGSKTIAVNPQIEGGNNVCFKSHYRKLGWE